MDYIETWKTIEKFFVKNGHASVPSYPAVCRWFPGLYFTVASIVAFQRSVAGKTTFELPANPLIIPQTCLRFPDIENVGRTGRHLTNFIMIGQHSISGRKGGYWKDKCIALDYKLLTRVLKIKPEEIVFVEDAWQGPSAFGSSLEYYVRGLELGNAVFTEFLGSPNNYKEMDQKVIDMGAGLERFTWLSQGTPTCYDAVFPMMKKLTKHVDYDKELFIKYANLAGRMEGGNETEIAKKLGVSLDDLAKLKPLEALYAIADHSKTLLFAITDGALPSNVGGGYNLRIVLRRALGFIEEFSLDIDLKDVCKEHAKYLKKMNPRLTESLDEVYEILDVEKRRFNETKNRSARIIEVLMKKGSITAEKMIELYESNGITPELIEKIAGKDKIIKPGNFYSRISEKHLSEKAEERIDIDTEGIPATRLLFYENQDKTEFTAKVLKIIDNKHVILDQTCFYGRSGGQEPDHGFLGDCEVYDADKEIGRAHV
jgi:alanyl-tRNA synthetase